MNLVTNIGKGIAVNRVKKTGDMAAYEAANEQYRQDGHKILDVAGTVTGFALDPTTWMSAGVGGMATRGAMWAGGRVLAGRGATAAVTNAATRQFATSMTGRVIGGIAGGAANFGTFEGIKEMETQFAHGGHIVGQDDTGRYLNEGYSASAVAGQAAHGFLMGGAIGWLTPVSGNVADKLVRSTSSTGLKVMERAGVYSGATMLEGTIFSVPEWIEGNRDAMDVWTDNMAMMVGFKAKHMIKSAGNVLGDLKASFDSPTNGRKNRLDFESRLRQRMDAPSDGGLSLTKDEAAELSKHGYGDLRELVESAERTGDATKGELITANAPEIVSRLTDMVTDPRISEAARAKMYYYATGRKLPESTVMKGELIEDGEGGFIVESQGANGVITSRSFKSRKAADLELERIKRQTELNHIEIGERYQQTADFENRLQEACRTVAAENGWDMVEVYRTCEEARRNNLRGGDKQFDEAQQNILRKVTEAMGEFEETSVTDNMRGRINDKYGVDIDNAIRKEANRRTIAEQTAIDEYLDELIPKNAKERNTVEDAEAEDITNQKLLTDEPEATTPTNDAPIDPRFDNPTTPEYDPHQPGGEQKPVGRAVMKYQDRPVEVLSGRVVMMEDGTMIDNERSDASIVVRDLETGKVEMVSPDAILSYEGYPAEVEVPQDNVAPEAETPAEPQPKYTTGQIKIRNSDGTETRGVLTGFVDENGNHEYYVEGDLQQLHYASEHELDNILSEYTPDEPQEVKQPQPAEPQPVDPNRPTQEGVANVEDYDKGYSFGIDETQGISDSELTAKISELRTDAERLTDFGRGMLEAYEYEQQRRAMEQQLVPVDAETVPKTEETTLNPMETGVNITETVPKTEIPIENVQQSVDDGNVVVPAPATNEAPQVDNVSQPDLTAQAEPTPLQRIPRNEKNEPIFEQAESPEVGWDALVEFSEGDAATAKEIADTMVEEKRKAFEKAQKLKPKGKTPTEILASKKANTAELTKAQAEYEQWQRMAGVENARQSAIRSQQEVEARRLAAERAEAEKAEREAREEAARLEREALEGIPEWHMDTPENARKRGVRRFSGQMFTRQEPVQGVVGNEVEVKFSQKDLPKGRVAVIEASQLQPSHVQGQRNPMFFIEEAQPKNRTEAVSMFAAKEMAEGIRPKEITGSVTAYTGAPTVNTRGEVIQGNNRSDALRYLWQSNLPQQQQTYKQYLIDNAEQFGIDPEAVNAMQNPVLVNMLDVDDAEAIRLGQMTAQDTESGGIERIKPKNVAQTLGDNMRTFANMLLSSGEEDVSFGQLVDRNGTEVMKWMNQVGAISNTQFQSAFDSKSNLTAEAKNDLQKVLYQAVFKGASQQLEEMFDKLPAKAQRAILATAFRDMDSPFAGKMLPEIQASIIVYNQLMSDPTFANAKKMEEVLKAVEAFKQTIALDDRFEHYMPADNFSNFALHLAAMYKATDMSQATIASYFNQMYDLAQGKKAATLFDEADTTEYPLAEVINQVLNFEYQPAKNGNNDVANGGADVALRNQVSQGGELRGNEPPASGEQTPTGTEPSDSGAGASDDSSTAGVEAVEGETPQSTDAAPATVQAAVEAASAEVNTEPTPAQAEAGNYKKGHITIGEFDITIENPAGSVRKGIDADGKEWSTTMANTYGYIKGTEGVDGDHIDVFLHENMDMWNGRKVYVVDQTNTDGSFDEHKVMLGFNNKDEAMSAYLANYDATWGQTHPGLRISETNIEDFNKWVQSSHRKTKPFADYSTVSKITDEAPVEQPTQPAAAITGEGYKVEPKPYTNKQGKTLDTYLVTFDRDFSKEELSTLRAKAKALKGWYDRETRGWMLRSADDAKAFAKDIVGKSEDEVADEAPLSLADMEKPASDKPKKAPVNRVNVEGVMADLSTKGETKLSDHAEPVEPTQTKPKKRRWISDEDADEFNNLRDNLRNHFGKGDDIVQESAEGYGKPQPKQMDAEVLRMGTRMTYLMMKGGLRSFADYCEAMIDELPDIFDDMRPHLKSLYAAAQNMEEVIELGWDEEMDDRKTVKAFDVYNFDKPGAKDIIATSQHIVDEQSSQQHTDQIIQTLKDQRNEQRKKEADETSADTEAIADKAEAVASKVESELEVATTEQDAERLSRDLDKEIEDVNKQLALLGYYEAVEDDSKFHESYGYMLTAEKKAVSDATNLAKQIVKDLGIDIKVTSATTPLGRKNVKKGTTVRANLAPAGGEIYITLPLNEGRHLKMYIGLEPVAEQDSRRRGDNLKTDRIMYRVEWPDEKGYVSFERIGRNCWAASNVTYDELLTAIRREARNYLPEDVVKPATPLTPQPGEDMVQMAERVAKLKAPKKSRIPDEQPMNDLFGGLFDEAEPKQDSAQFVKDMADMLERGESPFTVTPEVEAELAKQREAENNSTTPKNNSHEKTDVQARPETAGRGGQQPRPNEPLGTSAEHEAERTDGGRMAQRGGEHTVSDTKRGTGVSEQHKSERGVAQPKNIRNNHAERGVDYAPKGEKARIDANLAAIEVAKKLLASGETATPKEMEVLRRYSGWGGLGSAFNEGSTWSPNPINKRLREILTPEEYEAAVMSRNSAYYTPAPVIDAMWDIAKALGFKGGNIVEGSAGIGNIIGLMPTEISERSNIHAVEIDNTTGGILSLLYPDAKVEVQGFEKTRIANGSVDLAITNVPFVTGLHVMDESGDSDLSKKFRDIHDFCIAKNVRKLREGGIGIFITSSGTLDKSQKLRNWLVGDKEGCADVVGVFRMNNQTFGGTAATSDIIVVRKRVNGRKSANAIDISTVTPVRTASFEDDRGKTKDLPMLINRYFIEHPECMGGEMFFGFEQGDTYRPTSMGLFPTRTADQPARMAAWVQHIAEMDWSKEQGTAVAEQTTHINEALGKDVKEGSMVTDSNGNLCVARMGSAVPLTFNKNKIKGRTKEQCFADYTDLKNALADVLKYQTEHNDDAGLQPLLDRLNSAYDTFVARYGNLNKNNNLAWLRNDVDFSSIVALETYSEKGSKDGTKIKTYGKTDIFSRRVVEKESEPAPKNVKDGIIASLYKYGRIDPEYLASQLGKSQADVKQEIIESGLGFENPTTGQMEVSYEYLSGNVREKLRQAREANEAANGAYDANIKALEAVVPMNIPAHLIEFTLGSSWVDPKLYERFVKERTDLNVRLTNAGGTWHMSEPYWTDEPKNKEMGIRSESLGILIPGHKLIEAAITNKTITVSKTTKNSDGTTTTETDAAATTACATKVDEIRQDFKDWAREQMQNDPELSMRMEEVYNEKFNNSVPKSIPDEFVPEHFGGAATMVGGRPFRLRPHQAKAVIRATTQPVLLAHEVGTGKTYTLITTAMEMRRLGTARKPMIVVQNATVGQFVASAKALYPNAKVLTLEDADRNAEGRKAFYAKIKFNDWDMIVVPQSVFERIPDSVERQTQFIQDKIEEKLLVLDQMKDADPDGRSMIVRAAEREIEKLKDEISQLANGGATDKKKEKDAKKAAVTRQNAEVKAREMLDRATDDVEDFDSMGIDAILVDEAHEYKHLGFATAMQRGVKGVDPSFSKKSQGVFLKTQSVLEKTGGKNVVFATGTPISNTAAEIWTFMRYLMSADVMKDYGIYYFDDFVRNFGNLQQMLEFSTSGKYKENNRFAGYVNLPELVRIWSTVADTVLTREAGGVSDKIPQMEGGKAQDIFLPQTRALRSIMKFVKEQLDAYDNMSGKEKKENSHIPLVMYGIAKAAAVDARLVQSDAEDDPNSKTNEAVRQTLRTLEEAKDYNGTVAIFADNYQNKVSGFNLYEDIRKKLISAGVPEEQIVVMKSGMTVNKKLEIFSRVNAGEVRVIMGSTFTLGTGVNIQERLHTLIHLDAPNRPMDYTQRNGRILRQGNLHNEWGIPVRVLRFGVEDSLDVTAYQRLKTKGAIADSIMNGKQLMENSMENRALEEDQDLFGDITAQLSGSEYAMLKNQIEKEVRKLTAQRKSWEADQTYIHNRKRQIAGQNKEAEKRIAENKSYLEKVEAATVGDITVDKLSYPSVEAMEDFFTEQNKRKAELQEQVRKSGYSSRPATSDITISVGGFNFHVHTEINRETKQGQQGDLFYSAPAKMTYSCPELGIEAMPVKGNVIKNAVTEILNDVVSGEDFRGRIEAAERSIERNNAELQSISARDGVPFKFTEELAKAEEKLSEYEDLMKAEMEAKEAKYAELDKEVEAASNIELTEEDSEDAASEPIASYSEENANFASRYETQDGKTINYTSENAEGYGGLFDFDFSGENAGGNEVGMRSGANDLQRQGDTGLNRHNSRLDKEAGEFSLIERVFRESGSFNFTSGEKIESADDVAFIFSALEDAAKEHSFVVLVKDGKPTVVELGMGTFTATMVDIPTASLAYNRIQPDQVYFVHNHPSGNLMCSPQDVQMLRKIADISKVPVHGVIINLKTGKYGTFDTDNTSGVGQKRVPENESPLAVHTLDKQIFAPNYDPMEQPLVRGSEDVAKFLNSQRMGDRAKMSFIILSRAGRIVGNIHTPFTKLPTKSDEIARYISERVIQFGGESAILYGDFTHEGSKMVAYRNLKDNLNKVGGTTLLDVVNVEGNNTRSANDDGLLYELGSEYGASTEAKSSHAERMSKKFNTPIRIVTDTKELTNDNSERQARMRRSKGFYDPATGEVVIVLPNNANVEDVAETVFHEVVAHKGLREMIGEENYDAFCDEIYNHLKDDLKQQVEEDATRRFVNEPGKEYEHHRRVAVDEMFGRMSEKGFEDFTKAERGIWVKLKAKVLEAINKFLGSLKLPKWVKLGDNELRYMLWRSHEKLRTKGDYVDMARDAAKRDELGLSSDARFRDGETSDIWKDQSIGLEERITNAAIRLSNNQSADLTLRNDAMRAVTNNLQSLLHSMRNRRGTAQSFVGADRKVEAGVVDAMNAQAMFDRSTVKRVSDLARILMQNGYLSGMTSGEMQRLLSAVKNATAMHDIADSVQKIMDIMVDNQLRNGEASLRQLLAIRGSKVDARGVEVQGALDVDGQHTMEVVKKAISLTEDDITDRIAEALNRMSDPDQTIADQAAIEYAGLNMALDYVQNIANSKAEEKALRDSLKIAKEDRDAGRMTDDAYKQFIETTEDAIRKNKIERTEAYFNLVGRLSDSLRGSIENAKAFREAEKARISEIHHNANSDMEGRPTNEHHKDDWQDKFVNNGFVQFLFAPLGTFDQIMRVFGNKSANGEGYLWNRFMRGWVDCRNKELRGIKDKFAQLDEKAAELFGKSKTWGDIIRMERKLPKASVSFWDGGEMRDHELTQGNLLYIYMVDKMTDGRMKLRRMGITEQNVADIENFLDPRFKALGDWLQDDFLVATRNEYNETHKRMFGASMAAIENYFPLKILANARVDKEEDVNQQNRPDGITTKTGSIIKRRVNNLALDITGADALSVILDHITQMEHWSAYAEWNRDLNTLRTYKRFRNQVINMTTVYGGGRRLWENFNDLCLMAAGEYRPPVSRLNKNAVNLAKGVTAAKVSFRLFTALKQFLSAPAYAPEVNLKSIAKSIANPYGDFKWCLENLPIFRERWHSRISGDPRLLKSDMDWKMWRSRVMEISSRIGMTPNAFVDAVTVSIGARAMYETRLNQYLKEGYPADAAEKRAMQDATILFNQTQQSSESPFLSTMQVDKDWLSTLFTVFRNSSMSYTRQTYDGARNLKRNLTSAQRAKSVAFMTKQILRDWEIDPESATDDEYSRANDAARKRFRRQIKKDVIRLATFGYVLEWLWNLGPYLPYIIFGYYISEKDKMWDDVITHSYFGSIEGLTGGDVMSSFGNMWASGEWSRNQLSKDMPLASDINTIANKFIGGKNAEAVNDILNLLVQSGIGMNPQSLTDAAIAITDACGDDPALSHEAAIFVMRVLQVPQSQLDKLYFDEIGLNGEEASKLTPQQLAARYAEYKVKRGTPLAPWSWGDEERLGKYEELAKDRMTERLESRGDAAVKEAYADFEARYKAVNEKAEKARAMIKTDYAAAAQAHAALQQDPDFTLYQRFGSLDKQLGRISKMWLTSKTPEEAALIASTIPAYRAGMVKVLQAETVENQQSAMSELTTLMNEFYSKYQAMQPQSQQLNR
ncbi:helicase-related protein [Bacteroides congonensis]|nr:helicase-related protein [Bacteroides congonensis]